MVPLQALALEHYHSYQGKDCKRNHFLDDLELHKIERTSVVDEADSVCWNLGAIFKECHCP